MGNTKGKQKQVYIAHLKCLDFYKYYKNNYMKNKNRLVAKTNKYYLTYTLYIKILDAYNLMLKHDLLYKAKETMFPLSTGSLIIKKRKADSYIDANNNFVSTHPIDWNLTGQLWEEDEKAKKAKKFIRMLNPHSKGYVAKVYFGRANCKVKNRNRYSFITCRTFKLDIKAIMIDEDSPIDYVEKL